MIYICEDRYLIHSKNVKLLAKFVLLVLTATQLPKLTGKILKIRVKGHFTNRGALKLRREILFYSFVLHMVGCALDGQFNN